MQANLISSFFQKPMSGVIIFSLLWLLVNLFFIEDSYSFLINIQAQYYWLYGFIGFFLGIMYAMFFLFPFLPYKFFINLFIAVSPLNRTKPSSESKIKSLIMSILCACQAYFFAIILYVLATKYLIGTSFFFSVDDITNFTHVHFDVKVISNMFFSFLIIIPSVLATMATDCFAFIIYVIQLFPLISIIVITSITYYSYQRRQEYHHFEKV